MSPTGATTGSRSLPPTESSSSASARPAAETESSTGPPVWRFDADGDIYVADRDNNRVQLFNSEPRYVEQFIGDGTLSKASKAYMLTNAAPNRMRDMTEREPEKLLRRPASVKVDDQGRMYVPDYGRYRVQIYQKDVVRLDPTQFGPPRRSPTLLQE